LKCIQKWKYIWTIITNTYFITDGAELLPQGLESLESTLVSSYKCYEKALSLEPMDMDKNNLLRRLGNIHNELGVLYMNQAGCMYKLRTYNRGYNKYLLFID